MSDRCTILVIDDETEIVRSLTVRLRARGYEVLTATNGAAGLEQAFECGPDGILLDIRMSGMDGIEVLEKLRQVPRTRDIPVLVLSANIVEEVRSLALASGACCFLEKPFQSAKLLAAVDHMLGAPDTAGTEPKLADAHLP